MFFDIQSDEGGEGVPMTFQYFQHSNPLETNDSFEERAHMCLD